MKVWTLVVEKTAMPFCQRMPVVQHSYTSKDMNKVMNRGQGSSSGDRRLLLSWVLWCDRVVHNRVSLLIVHPEATCSYFSLPALRLWLLLLLAGGFCGTLLFFLSRLSHRLEAVLWMRPSNLLNLSMNTSVSKLFPKSGCTCKYYDIVKV